MAARIEKCGNVWRCLFAIGIAFILCSGGIGFLNATSEASAKAPLAALDNYLYVGMLDEPKSLNPVIPNDVWSSNFLNRMWDRTTERDPDDQSIQPFMATDWQMVNDGTNRNFTVHYRLDKWLYVYTDDAHTQLVRKLILFHDGHEVDIYDLLFSFELSMKVPRWSSSFESLDKTPNGTVIPPDGDALHAIHIVRGVSMDADPNLKGYTVHYSLNRTDASWELNYVGMTIYPYHLWKDKFYSGQFNTWNIENEANPKQYEIGSGAFKYSQWIKGGQYAQLDTFTDYFPWNKMPRDAQGNPPPALAGTDWHWEVKVSPVAVDPSQTPWGKRPAQPNTDGIKYKIYYSIDTAILALQNGDVDVNWFPIDPGYIPQLSGNPNIQLVSYDDTGFPYISFNMRKQTFGYDDWPSATRVDKGKAFRQAVALCTDKDSIVKRLIMNYGTMGDSVISPANTEWYNPNIKTYPFDPDEAERILDAAGHTVDGTGWRDLGPPIGNSKFYLIHSTKDYDSIKYEAARMIVDQLQKIHVNIQSKPLQYGQVTELINNRNFDMYLYNFNAWLEPDYIYELFHSSQAGMGLSNHPGYHNDTFDKLLDESRSEMNVSKRKDMIKQAQAIIAEDCVYDVLYYRTIYEAYRKDRWGGWVRTTGGIMNRWSFNFIGTPQPMLYIDTILPKEMNNNSSSTVNIGVTDSKTAYLIANANVNLTINASDGKDPGYLEEIRGRHYAEKNTSSSGKAEISYRSPSSPDWNYTVKFSFKVSKNGYQDSWAFGVVYPFGVLKYLTAKIDIKSSTINVTEGESGTLRLSVVNQIDERVAGISVSLSAEPSVGLTLPNYTITDSSGAVTITYNTSRAGKYNITATPVTTANYTEAFPDNFTVVVKPKPQDKPLLLQPVVIAGALAVTGITLAALTILIYIPWKRRRNKNS